VTSAAGSDAAFWVRAPGAVLHGLTALVLGRVALRLFGEGPALAVAVGYVTLPMAALGSLLFSTDTVMLPLLAVALWFWVAGLRGAGPGSAALAGAFCGLAVIAKYAGLFLPLGLLAAAAVSPGWRVPPRRWLAFLAALAVVVAPNLIWNFSHDLATLSHTADNAGWLRGGPSPSVSALAVFLLSQLAVVGPVVAVVAALRLVRPGGGDTAALAALAAVPLAVIAGQALLDGANANWAVAGWLPGTMIALAWLADRPGWLRLSLAINGAVSLALPLVVMAPGLRLGEEPLLARYLGRAELSRQVIAAAQSAGGLPVVADRRDVLADLFYTGRDSGLVFLARPHDKRPSHFYEQVHMMPRDMTGDVLLVTADPGRCAAGQPMPLNAEGGAYAGEGLMVWQVTAGCLVARH
jgi:4-amino-4-deoxy-L-arabinose transferase-like glycosyltransferase